MTDGIRGGGVLVWMIAWNSSWGFFYQPLRAEGPVITSLNDRSSSSVWNKSVFVLLCSARSLFLTKKGKQVICASHPQSSRVIDGHIEISSLSMMLAAFHKCFNFKFHVGKEIVHPVRLCFCFEGSVKGNCRLQHPDCCHHSSDWNAWMLNSTLKTGKSCYPQSFIFCSSLSFIYTRKTLQLGGKTV